MSEKKSKNRVYPAEAVPHGVSYPSVAVEISPSSVESASTDENSGSCWTETPAAGGIREPGYTKQQLMASARYRNHRDLLSALLDEGELYTLAGADRMVEKFMKGKVK